MLDFLRKSKFKDRIDTVSEPKLLGTAGTIANNYDYFAGQSCLVAHADNFCVCDFNKFIAAHENRPSHTCMTMMTFNAPDPKQCGVIELDENQVVQQFFEKVDNFKGMSVLVYPCHWGNSKEDDNMKEKSGKLSIMEFKS